jgi:hypothetical protein
MVEEWNGGMLAGVRQKNLGKRERPRQRFNCACYNGDNAVGSWRIVFLAAVAGAVARFYRRELRDGKYFSLCTAAVPGQNGHGCAHYLRSLGDLVPPHTRV